MCDWEAHLHRLRDFYQQLPAAVFLTTTTPPLIVASVLVTTTRRSGLHGPGAPQPSRLLTTTLDTYQPGRPANISTSFKPSLRDRPTARRNSMSRCNSSRLSPSPEPRAYHQEQERPHAARRMMMASRDRNVTSYLVRPRLSGATMSSRLRMSSLGKQTKKAHAGASCQGRSFSISLLECRTLMCDLGGSDFPT